MLFDATGLASFYEEPLGQVTRRLILRRVRLAWPDLRGLRVLGYGFAVPYLRPILSEAALAVGFMPAQQGVVAWPAQLPLVVAGDEDALPFPDAMFDRIVMIHGLETAESTRPVLRQLWRVLAPAGRLLVVVPNRTSLWAQVERSPFAHGTPFTRSQLDRLMRQSLFVPERWDTALLLPPLRSRRLIRNGVGWERFGRRVWPGFAGVHLVDASKSLYAMVPPAEAKPVRQKLARADI
jgi:SAM-dependent methyltransferase